MLWYTTPWCLLIAYHNIPKEGLDADQCLEHHVESVLLHDVETDFHHSLAEDVGCHDLDFRVLDAMSRLWGNGRRFTPICAGASRMDLASATWGW